MILSIIILIIIIIIHILFSFSTWANVTFQCYGKSMRQKFLMLPQTITVDLSTKTKYHVDNMDKEIKMHTHTYHPLLRIF